MNPTEKRELLQDIGRIRERGVSVLLIEHDMGLIQGVCERVVVLDHGVKIAEGEFGAVRRNPVVVEAYLGRRHA
jgi:ABC-type branched-subunit amino acid transport system ATPase component